MGNLFEIKEQVFNSIEVVELSLVRLKGRLRSSKCISIKTSQLWPLLIIPTVPYMEKNS